ncbi:MAG: 3-sulfinopropanoyl-CoA desulfinase [Actinomycetota bacterium]|nr:3-sulfinopropanoyl-CoA desulfinase [Actinomycetota bacterium]MEC9394989.1 3-sulfinopropanoyl-CoA desulfinase [Actinomycetota bacterium]MED5394842.1 3-sulfinopropanoyl-CoA desulfinase [Actinomycetota bacterium]MED6327998.1 3-sulfinopropanoyl-CoA desulfinase [Actinomycetota bacterium]MEE2957707.1 3-sulfinopropanoyl-CoA desulfinase [Actinomycetota bacterium]
MSLDDRNWNLTDDQEELRLRARQLAVEVVAPRAAEVDRTESYPWDVVEALREAGFMGMTLPEAFGGAGRSFLEAALVVEEMARECGVTGRIVVEANMGAVSAIMAYGTEDQKRLAADLVLGGDKPAICITEPEAGSAASQMTTRADRHGDRYVLNGKKHWITGGGVSRLHLVFARVFDEQGAEEGIGGFLAIRDENPGLVIGRREPTMGLRGIPETEVLLEDMEVAPEMVLVPPSGFGRGFAELMNAYNSQRVGAATVALGLAAGAHDRAVDHTRGREQFGRPIAEFQGVQWMLADMAIQLEAARSLIWRAAASRGPAGSPFPDPGMAAQAKVFASEAGIQVANDALQLFGAAGYSRDYPIERICRDVRMFTIGGGTAQILRTVVASRVLGMRLPQERGGFLTG